MANTPPTHYAIVSTTLEKHILPHFAALRDAAAPLPMAVDSVCHRGGEAAHEAAISAFRNTVRAWAGVQYLRFGPMIEQARRERMSFWPDPRGVMKRQLRSLIAQADEKSVVGDGVIAKQSAAVQGLPALEVLLTDEAVPLGSGDQAAFRCKLAVAIAKNVSDIAAGLYSDWSKEGGWKDKMLRPGSDNDTYKEPQEAANELVKAFLTGLSLIADTEVKPQLDEKARFVPPFEKADASKDYFIHGIRSLAELYEVMNLEVFLPEDKFWVVNLAGGAWRTLKASDGAGGAAPGIAKRDAPLLRRVFGMLAGLRKVTLVELSPAAGLTVGFNELDGD